MFDLLAKNLLRETRITLKRVVGSFLSLILVMSQLAGGLLLPLKAEAAIPAILNYQLRLTDLNGIPVADGSKNLKITIYDAVSGGNQLYTFCATTDSPIGTPEFLPVTFTNGVASVLIGDTSITCNSSGFEQAIPTTLFTNTSLFLGVTVSPDGEMTPRKRVAASGYALNSELLDGFNTSQAGGANAHVPVTDSSGLLTITGGTTISGAAVNLNASSNFAVNLATGTSTGTVTIGSGTSSQALLLQSGTGDVAITSTDDISVGANASATDVFIGNETGASSLVLKAGTGNITIDGVAATTITIGDAAQTGAISLGASTANMTLNLGTGVGVHTINLGTGGTGADVITIGGNVGTVAIDSGDWDISTVGNLSGIGSIGLDGTITFSGVTTDITTASGEALTLTAAGSGDLVVSLDADSNAQFTASAAPGVDMVAISHGGNASTTSGVDALQLTFGTSNASGNVVDITPSFAGGATDALTYNVVDIDAFSPTNGAGTDTVRGLNIGALTDPGATITSTAINVGSGWDTGLVVNGVTIVDGTGAIVASLNCTDCLDFDDFEDTLDLDAALTLNQTTNAWTQSFTGTTATGYTYNANSFTANGSSGALEYTLNAIANGVGMRLSTSSASYGSTDLFRILANPTVSGTNVTGSLFDVQSTPTISATTDFTTDSVASVSRDINRGTGITGIDVTSHVMTVSDASTTGTSTFNTHQAAVLFVDQNVTANTQGALLVDTSATSAAASGLYVSDDGTGQSDATAFFVTSQGKVGIGTNTTTVGVSNTYKLYVVSDDTKGAFFDLTSVTTSNGVEIFVPALTSGTGFQVRSDGAGGAFAGTVSGDMANVQWNPSILGTADFSSTGNLLSLLRSPNIVGTYSAAGALLRVQDTVTGGTPSSVTANVAEFLQSNTVATTGSVIAITQASTTSGNGISITSNSSTTGDIINATANAMTTGSVLDFSTSGTFSGNVVQLAATGAATGDFIEITSTNASATAKALNIDLDNGNTNNSVITLLTDETTISGNGADAAKFTLTSAGSLSMTGLLTVTSTRAADTGATNNGQLLTLTTPADTTGTNVHQGIFVDPTIGNASGGTNTVNLIATDAVTGDAQVTLRALNIGALTGTAATEVAINIGSGWDAGLVVNGVTIVDGTGAIVASLNCTDCLDFDDFEDTMDLDTALTLNQTTNTWSQTFTGDTTTGLTYTANSLTTGTAVALTSSGTITSGGQLMSLTANSATTGNILTISGNGLTTGKGISVTVDDSITADSGAAMFIDYETASPALDSVFIVESDCTGDTTCSGTSDNNRVFKINSSGEAFSDVGFTAGGASTKYYDGSVTTTQSTFNLINTDATTVNFAGAATTIAIGAATGQTNFGHGVDIGGNLEVSGTGGISFTETAADIAFKDGAVIDNNAAGTLALTPGGATGLVNVVTGNLKVGNGTPGVTLDGEDAYIEGALEVDGGLQFDGAFVLGDGGDTGAINTSDWDISTTGDMTGVGAITMNGNLSQTGVTSISTGTDGLLANGLVTLAADQNLLFTTGTGRYVQNFTGTTTTAMTITANSLTAGQILGLNGTVTPSTAVTAAPFQMGITNNSASNSATILPFSFDYTHDPSVSASLVNVMRLQNGVTSDTDDTTVDSLLLINNADTSAAGSTVITDAIRITNSGGIAGGITNAINIASSTVTTDLVMQNGESIDNDTNGTVNVVGILQANSGFTQTFAGTTTDAISLSAPSLTSGRAIFVDVTSTPNGASIFSPLSFSLTNTGTNGSATYIGNRIDYNHNPTVSGINEKIVRIFVVPTADTDDTVITSLLELNNADTDTSGSTIVANGLLIGLDNVLTDGITDAIDASDVNIVNALNVGANIILGTTATIDFTNFDVDGSGNLVAAGSITATGFDVGSGTLGLGNTNASAVSICNSATCDTVTIATNADADTVTIGDSANDTVSLGGTSIALNGPTTLGANSGLTFSSGTGRYDQTFSGTTTNAMTLQATSLTTGSAVSLSSIHATSTANTVRSMILSSVNNISNSSASIESLNIEYLQNPSTTTSANVVVISNASTTDTDDLTVNSLLRLDNADTSATGSTVVADALRITNSGAIDGGITNAINIASSTITTDLSLQNGETIDNNTDGTINVGGALQVAANNNFSMASGTGTFIQTYTNTTGTAHSIVANSVTTGAGYSLSATGLTTGNAFVSSATSNIATASTMAVNEFLVTNAATSSSATVLGVNIDFVHDPVAATPTEYAMQIKNNVTTDTNDTTVSGLLRLDNADTSGTGSTAVADALVVTVSGSLANGIVDAVDATDTNITNALNAGTNDIAITTGTIGSNGATVINFAEFDVASATGSVTIDDGGNAGQLLVEGTNLDINSLDFVGVGTISSASTLAVTSGSTLSLSSAAASALTINSGTTGTINIGDDSSVESINIGTGSGAKAVTVGGGSSGTTLSVIAGGAGAQGVFFSLGSTDTNGFDILSSATTAGAIGIFANSMTTGTGLTLTTSNTQTSSTGFGAQFLATHAPTTGTGTGALFSLTNNATGAATLRAVDVQINHDPTAATTVNGVRVVNLVTTDTNDTTIESLLLLDNEDTSATGSTVITDALRITNSGAIAGGITNAINIASTTVTTDIVLQNGETLDNNTDGFLTLNGVMTITGQQAASVGAGTGTASNDTIFTMGTGGDTTIATTGTGGVGGDFRINAGVGGVADSAATTSTGGAGGTIVYSTGAGGAASVAGTTRNGGTGGAFTLTVGTGGLASGGTTDNSGDGGAISLTAGAGRATTDAAGTTNTGGNGGAFTLTAGTGGAASGASTTNTGGPGGALTMAAGNGGSAGGGTGGSVTINAGDAQSGTSNGGSITLSAGTSSGGTAGGINLNPGTTTSLVDINGFMNLNIDGAGGDTTIGVCKTVADSAGTESNVELVDCSGTPGDIAEWYETTGVEAVGDIVAMTSSLRAYSEELYDPFTGLGTDVVANYNAAIAAKTTVAYAEVLGVVSTSPLQVMGEGLKDFSTNAQPIAVVGRVPTKVSAVNGAIAAGDPIATSNVAGVGMKATKPGAIIGYALEPYSGVGTASIQVFVRPGWYGGNVIGTDGSSSIFKDNFIVSATAAATAIDTNNDSFGLTFAGSAWDATNSQSVGLGVSFKNLVTDIDNYRLAVLNDAGAEVAYYGSNGDLAIGGKLFLSDRGAMQNSKYIYYDGSAGPGGDFIRTNAAGWGTGSYDFAEMYASELPLMPGELVMIDANKAVAMTKAVKSGDEQVILAGIVSTRPGFLAGTNDPGAYPIALSGRVPTKVSVASGAIAIGDAITVSETPGVGAKATMGAYVVGYALQATDVDGVIEVFVRPGWYNGDGIVATSSTASQGSINISSSIGDTDINMQGRAILAVGLIRGVNDVWSVDENGVLKVKEVVADKVTTKQIVVDQENDSQAAGEGKIEVGNSRVTIDNPLAKSNSRIFVTFLNNTEGNWWISRRSDGQFEITLSKVANLDLMFEYLIVGVQDNRVEPTDLGVSSVAVEPAPVVEEPAAPVTEEAVPVVEEPAPVTEVVPAPTIEPAPVTEAPAPVVVEEPAPVVEEPAPVTEGVPVPVEEPAAPTETQITSLPAEPTIP